MNPKTNKFEPLTLEQRNQIGDLEKKIDGILGLSTELVRPNGEPVPRHWTVLRVGEHVVVKNYTFRVAHIGESHLLLEPVGEVLDVEDLE